MICLPRSVARLGVPFLRPPVFLPIAIVVLRAVKLKKGKQR